MKRFCIGVIIFTSLVLCLYPFVLMANLMAIAALPAGGGPPESTKLMITAFAWSSTFYPLAYLVALVASVWNLRIQKPKAALFWQVGLLGYLILTVGFLLNS